MLKISSISRILLPNTGKWLFLQKAGILSSRFSSYHFNDNNVNDYLLTVILLDFHLLY